MLVSNSNPSLDSDNHSTETNKGITTDYLNELIKDQQQLLNMNDVFQHVPRLLEEEIQHTRIVLSHTNHEADADNDFDLPEEAGEITTLTEKVFIPLSENPNYNFVGRILGPGGMTAKHMERCLGCKIMIRGKGSMRDKKKEEQNKGKKNWEHLSENLHILLSVRDYESRIRARMDRVVAEIRKFLDEAIHTPESEDKLKQMQLMELAARNQASKQALFVPQPFSYGHPTYPGAVLSLNPSILPSVDGPGLVNPCIITGTDVNTALPGSINPLFATNVGSANMLPTMSQTISPGQVYPTSLLRNQYVDPQLVAMFAMQHVNNGQSAGVGAVPGLLLSSANQLVSTLTAPNTNNGASSNGHVHDAKGTFLPSAQTHPSKLYCSANSETGTMQGCGSYVGMSDAFVYPSMSCDQQAKQEMT